MALKLQVCSGGRRRCATLPLVVLTLAVVSLLAGPVAAQGQTGTYQAPASSGNADSGLQRDLAGVDDRQLGHSGSWL